ncbi:MAG: substrate-binding domain-containing protein [Burkholderiaceae bacterium]|nr:substrate-binding domain-containing protein [Burkholderiaceae bacterium]
MSSALHIISSMATRQVLTDLIADYQKTSGAQVRLESVGGVDAAKRVQADEPFDGVILGSDALDKLIAAGKVAGRTDLVNSPVAVAVKAGAPVPDLGSEDAVRRAVLAARTLSYSTGPSGVALAKLFERWGVMDEIRERIVTPPPGIPVGSLVAKGEVELGFQQLSELINLPGITLAGNLPADIAIVTTFSGGVAATSQQPDAVRALLAYLASPAASDAKRRQGMEPA